MPRDPSPQQNKGKPSEGRWGPPRLSSFVPRRGAFPHPTAGGSIALQVSPSPGSRARIRLRCPLFRQGFTGAFETRGPRKLKAGGVSYQHSSRLAHAGPRGRGQGASQSPPPAAESRGTPGVSAGHHGPRWVTQAAGATQRVGDRAGSKRPPCFLPGCPPALNASPSDPISHPGRYWPPSLFDSGLAALRQKRPRIAA